MTSGAFVAAAVIAFATPAAAQFYKSRTLTLLVNYGAGGNVDTEARILTRYLPRHIAGNPTIVILVCFFSGVQLFFSGVLGEYISAIHSQVRKRPLPTIQSNTTVQEE